MAGAEKAVLVAKELEAKGFKLGSVRLDSGDLAQISKKVRAVLDANNLEYVKIFASGDLDEFKITKLFNDGAKIDAFGVGTKMGTSADRPYLDVIYKLCETLRPDNVFSPIMKLSKGKITLPGRKQVYRFKDKDGVFIKDIVTLVDENIEAEGLLVNVMKNGQLFYDLPSLDQIRATALENITKLPEEYKTLTNAPTYPVEISQKLQNLIESLKLELTEKEINNGIY